MRKIHFLRLVVIVDIVHGYWPDIRMFPQNSFSGANTP